MATMSREPAPQPLADDGSSNLLLEVGRTIRDNFHILAGLSLLYLVVALPFIVFATVLSWTVAFAPLVLATAPLWAVIVACADRMLAAEGTPWQVAVADLRRFAWPAVRIGIVPAICGSLLLATAARAESSSLSATVAMALGGVAVAIVVLLVPAAPIAVRTGVSGLVLWQASAFVAIRRPAQVLGTVTLAGIGIWLTFAFGPAALLGVAPLGVLVAAITLPDPG